MSHLRRTRPIAGLMLAGLLLAATSMLVAAAASVLPGTASTAPAAGAASAAPTVSLRVVADDGDGPRFGARLSCRGSGARASGYLRYRAARACRQARRLAAFLDSRPSRTRPCDQLYGGPDTARVRGTIGRREIDRRFSRTDGCQIADWDRAGALLPRPGAGP